jgi:hypothetical protein
MNLKNTSMVAYADDTSFVITGNNPAQFSVDMNTVFNKINEWFRSNLMFLNIEKHIFYNSGQKIARRLI